MDRHIRKLYAFSFFDGFILIYPLYTVMFSQARVSPAGIGVLLGVWSSVSFLLEVPTGVIADRYSRRQILFWSQLVRAAGYAVWLLLPNFWGFLAGFILWGIKSAFTHGTFQSLIYDHLKQDGREGDYARVIGRTKTASYAAIMLASICAAVAVKFGGYPLVLGLSVAAGLVAAVSILAFPAPHIHEAREVENPFAIFRSGLSAVLSNGLVLKLVIFVSIVHGMGGAIDEYFPLFGQLTKIPLAAIPLFIGALNATQAVAAFYVSRFEKLPMPALYAGFGLTGALMIAASLLLGLPSLGLLCAFSAIYVVVSTTVEVQVQHQIPSAVRATATSAQAFAVEIAVLSVYFGFGFLAQTYDYDRAFLGFGVASVAIAALYLASSLWPMRVR